MGQSVKGGTWRGKQCTPRRLRRQTTVPLRSDLISASAADMIKIALLAAAAVAVASAAREGKMMATTEYVTYWVKTDFYCYKTDKLIIPIKKFKECESSGGYDRHKRSVIIDDRIETTEEDFIVDKFINPSKPAVIDIEKREAEEEPLVGSSINPSRKARFFNKYIITFTSTVWLTKYTGTTSIKFKCTPEYSFIPNCDTDNLKDWIQNKLDKKQDNDRPSYNSYGSSHGSSYNDHRPSYGSHYGEGSYDSGSAKPEGFGLFGGGLFGKK